MLYLCKVYFLKVVSAPVFHSDGESDQLGYWQFNVAWIQGFSNECLAEMVLDRKKLLWQIDLSPSSAVTQWPLQRTDFCLFLILCFLLGIGGWCHCLRGTHFIESQWHAKELLSIFDISLCFSPSACLFFLFLFLSLAVYFPCFFFPSILVSSWNDSATQRTYPLSLFSSVPFYYRCLLWIRTCTVSKSWQAFSGSYVTSGRQLSAVQNVFLWIICTLKSLVDTLTYPQWPSKSMAHPSNILFHLNATGHW